MHASNIPNATVRDRLYLVPCTSNSTAVLFKITDNSVGLNRLRLLLVISNLLDDVRRTLSNSRLLPRGFSITSDRTLVQRQSLRNLRTQTVEVRYVDNLPTIKDEVLQRDLLHSN